MKHTTRLAAAAACVLSSSAFATDLYVGSPNTIYAQAPVPGGAFQNLGACGGQIAAAAAEGGELYLAADFERIYLYRHDTQGSAPWIDLPGETLTGLAIRGHELLVATASAKVLAFDRSSSAFLRQWDLPVPATTLLVDRGELLSGTDFGAALRLADDGTFDFLGSCGASVRGIAASATEFFFASAGATIWRVDRASGFVTTSFPIAEEPTGVVLDQGVLYIPSATGMVRAYDAARGAALSAQNWGFPISAIALGAASAGDAYCFGDSALCPCGVGDPFGGCPSHIGVGARLITYGSASVASDDLELAVLDLPPTTLGRFYMGASVAQVPFGNGLLCAGAGGYGQFRFPVQAAHASAGRGSFRFGPAIVAHSQANFGLLGAIQPGSTWRFQAWFRDAQNPCGGGFDTSNASSVTFQL